MPSAWDCLCGRGWPAIRPHAAICIECVREELLRGGRFCHIPDLPKLQREGATFMTAVGPVKLAGEEIWETPDDMARWWRDHKTGKD